MGAPRCRPAGQEERVIMAAKAAVSADPLGLVSELVDTGNVDTVYRDVYLQRARTLMAGVLSLAEFRRIEQEKAELATLPVMIAERWRRPTGRASLSCRGRRFAVGGGQRQIETVERYVVPTSLDLLSRPAAVQPARRE
jgi:hypothetical protein